MIIEITSSGGFAGLAATNINKRVDVDAQPAELRQEICNLFEPTGLNALATPPMDGAADMRSYHITVTDHDQAKHKYTIREDQIPPEMLDLIDGM